MHDVLDPWTNPVTYAIRFFRHAATWRMRLGYLFMPPDWQPAPAGAPDAASAPASA